MPGPGVEEQTIIKQKLVGESAPQRHPGVGTPGQQCGQSMGCVCVVKGRDWHFRARERSRG